MRSSTGPGMDIGPDSGLLMDSHTDLDSGIGLNTDMGLGMGSDMPSSGMIASLSATRGNSGV